MGHFFRNAGIFIAGFFSSIVLGIVVITILIIQFSGKKIVINPDSFLLVEIPEIISERPVAKDSFFSNSNSIQLYSIIKAINNAAKDQRIRGIIIHGDMIHVTSAQAFEIRAALLNFKKEGKKIISYFSSATIDSYLVTSCSDEIIMPPTASADLSLTGYSISIPYYKEIFDKYGISYNVIHTGKYKGTGENYVRKTMSEELINQYTSVFDALFHEKISIISKDRNISKLELLQLFDNGLNIFITPDKALNLHLIDQTKTYESLLNDLFGSDKNKTVIIQEYINAEIPDFLHKSDNDKIVILYADGVISNYFTGEGYFNGKTTGAKSLNADIESIIQDNAVKAVILRVNSPGGSALASELILQELLRLKQYKKLYVSMGDYAASGGYYISIPAEKIYSNPLTITGSIGVVSMFMDISELLNTNGIKIETLKKYSYDDIFNYSRKPSADEIQKLQLHSQSIYDEFISHVVTYRKIDKDRIPFLAEGRIWSGSQAVQLNLADSTATLQEVIDKIIDDLKLPVNTKIEEFPKPQTLMDKISSRNMISLRTDINKLWVKFLGAEMVQTVEFYLENGKKPALLYTPSGSVYE